MRIGPRTTGFFPPILRLFRDGVAFIRAGVTFIPPGQNLVRAGWAIFRAEKTWSGVERVASRVDKSPSLKAKSPPEPQRTASGLEKRLWGREVIFAGREKVPSETEEMRPEPTGCPSGSTQRPSTLERCFWCPTKTLTVPEKAASRCRSNSPLVQLHGPGNSGLYLTLPLCAMRSVRSKATLEVAVAYWAFILGFRLLVEERRRKTPERVCSVNKVFHII